MTETNVLNKLDKVRIIFLEKEEVCIQHLFVSIIYTPTN